MQGSFGNNYFSRGEIQNIKFGNLHQIDVPQHLRRQGGSDCLVHGVIWFELTSSKFCDATSEMADVPLWALHLSKGCFLTVFCLVWLNWEGVKIFKTSCVRRYVLLAVAADPARLFWYFNQKAFIAEVYGKKDLTTKCWMLPWPLVEDRSVIMARVVISQQIWSHILFYRTMGLCDNKLGKGTI